MTPIEIQELFNTVLHADVKHGQTLESRVPGLTRNMVFNWRNNRTVPSLGDMLNVIYRLNLIDIHKKESDDKTKKIDSVFELGDYMNKFAENIKK